MADGVLIFATPLSLARSIAGALLHQSLTATGDRFPDGRRGNATAGTERQDLQRLWKYPTDISEFSFLVGQMICTKGQTPFSRSHSRLATLSLTVKSDPQRPERARPPRASLGRSLGRTALQEKVKEERERDRTTTAVDFGGVNEKAASRPRV